MYYYYYYNSFVQLNFRFLGEYPNTKSKDENISTNDIEFAKKSKANFKIINGTILNLKNDE